MRFGKERDDDENHEDLGHFFQGDFEDFDDMDYMDDEAARELRAVELTLVEANLNRRILVGVVKMLESSWLWKFTRYETKLKMIKESYKTFSKLISDSEEE
jgi:hypothetical protein